METFLAKRFHSRQKLVLNFVSSPADVRKVTKARFKTSTSIHNQNYPVKYK